MIWVVASQVLDTLCISRKVTKVHRACIAFPVCLLHYYAWWPTRLSGGKTRGSWGRPLPTSVGRTMLSSRLHKNWKLRWHALQLDLLICCCESQNFKEQCRGQGGSGGRGRANGVCLRNIVSLLCLVYATLYTVCLLLILGRWISIYQFV